MSKLFYPAIFHVADEGGFWVTFPDFPECITEGDDMTQAYEMALDALGLALMEFLDHAAPAPVPTSPDKIRVETNEFIVVLEFDPIQYRKKHNSKSIKKTLTIPEWLNELATKQNINFSQVLQEALMAKVKF